MKKHLYTNKSSRKATAALTLKRFFHITEKLDLAIKKRKFTQPFCAL
jgi:hypothetical protein